MTMPPLLAAMAGRKVRPRKAPVIRPLEIVLHMATADLLRRHGAADWRWTHIPSGELRDAKTAAKLKQMGTARGWADFEMLSPRGLAHFLELKRIGEDLTDDQRDFQTYCIAHGYPFAVARTVDDVLAIFAVWGCLRIKLAAGRRA